MAKHAWVWILVGCLLAQTGRSWGSVIVPEAKSTSSLVPSGAPAGASGPATETQFEEEVTAAAGPTEQPSLAPAPGENPFADAPVPSGILPPPPPPDGLSQEYSKRSDGSWGGFSEGLNEHELPLQGMNARTHACMHAHDLGWQARAGACLLAAPGRRGWPQARDLQARIRGSYPTTALAHLRAPGRRRTGSPALDRGDHARKPWPHHAHLCPPSPTFSDTLPCASFQRRAANLTSFLDPGNAYTPALNSSQEAALANLSTWRSGKATVSANRNFTSIGCQTLNCGMGYVNPHFSTHFVGISPAYYGSGQYCGLCMNVTCVDTVCPDAMLEYATFMIVDSCAACDTDDILISAPGFANLTGVSYDINPTMMLAWTPIKCTAYITGARVWLEGGLFGSEARGAVTPRAPDAMPGGQLPVEKRGERSMILVAGLRGTDAPACSWQHGSCR